MLGGFSHWSRGWERGLGSAEAVAARRRLRRRVHEAVAVKGCSLDHLCVGGDRPAFRIRTRKKTVHLTKLETFQRETPFFNHLFHILFVISFHCKQKQDTCLLHTESKVTRFTRSRGSRIVALGLSFRWSWPLIWYSYWLRVHLTVGDTQGFLSYFFLKPGQSHVSR